MTRTVRALLAATALATSVAPAAFGSGPSHHVGDCRVVSVQQDDVSGSQPDLILYGAFALYSDDGGPATATVRCEVRIDSTAVSAASGTGTGALAVLGRADMWWYDETLELCTVVDFADATPTATTCGPLFTQVPPQFVFDTLDAVLGRVWAVVDPVVCGALAEQAPGTGPVSINDQGDVYVAGEPVWDCPPYDIEW